MSDEVYHALPALSATGVKQMAASPMLFWAKCSWLNPECAEEKEEAEKDKDHLPIGKAYHCRILEGADDYASRFVVRPEKPDFGEGVLVTSDEIKNRIRELGEAEGIKPLGTITDGTTKRQAKKEDWIEQLLALDPEAKIYDLLMRDFEDEFEREHAGKVQLPSKVHRRIEIAAMMVERDHHIGPHLKGGYAEVVLIWRCPETGVPMKAKVDKMKVKRMLDLKTVANQRERSIEQAIRFEISGWKLNIQPSVYFEGAQEVRKTVREHGASSIHSLDNASVEEHRERVAWSLKWASHALPDEWGWIFQQKGIAPVTRLVWYPRGSTKTMTDDIVSLQKKRFRRCAEHFGTAPWLDTAEPYWINDDDIPASATEI